MEFSISAETLHLIEERLGRDAADKALRSVYRSTRLSEAGVIVLIGLTSVVLVGAIIGTWSWAINETNRVAGESIARVIIPGILAILLVLIISRTPVFLWLLDRFGGHLKSQTEQLLERVEQLSNDVDVRLQETHRHMEQHEATMQERERLLDEQEELLERQANPKPGSE